MTKLEEVKAALSPSELEAVASAIRAKNYPAEDFRLWRRCSQGHLGAWYYRKADENGFKRTRCRGCDLARIEKKESSSRPALSLPAGNLMALPRKADLPALGRAIFGARPRAARPSQAGV